MTTTIFLIILLALVIVLATVVFWLVKLQKQSAEHTKELEIAAHQILVLSSRVHDQHKSIIAMNGVADKMDDHLAATHKMVVALDNAFREHNAKIEAFREHVHLKHDAQQKINADLFECSMMVSSIVFKMLAQLELHPEDKIGILKQSLMSLDYLILFKDTHEIPVHVLQKLRLSMGDYYRMVTENNNDTPPNLSIKGFEIMANGQDPDTKKFAVPHCRIVAGSIVEAIQKLDRFMSTKELTDDIKLITPIEEIDFSNHEKQHP